MNSEDKAVKHSPEREAMGEGELQQAYKLGFMRAAEWCGRPDLRADTDSPAYLLDRDADLRKFDQPTPAPSEVSQAGPLRYTFDGALAECPCCGSLDVGGAQNTVHCYRCSLSMTKEGPLANAIAAWNTRKRLPAAAVTGESYAPFNEAKELESFMAAHHGAREARIEGRPCPYPPGSLWHQLFMAWCNRARLASTPPAAAVAVPVAWYARWPDGEVGTTYFESERDDWASDPSVEIRPLVFGDAVPPAPAAAVAEPDREQCLKMASAAGFTEHEIVGGWYVSDIPSICSLVRSASKPGASPPAPAASAQGDEV